METRQHAQGEAEKPCLWRGFLLSNAIGSFSFAAIQRAFKTFAR
ncbi:hypothetical protein SynMVIR181_01211 [Synechococcus sp. MVIR-18-1]|nr:hypothetical protein SynMVIR181_01211 [Synechococcus sp. MVIR-18-1]